MKSPMDTVADAVIAADTPEKRREVASAYVIYGLAVLAAMDGGEKAAEVGYRLSDALVARTR